jgi:hypothetical protein
MSGRVGKRHSSVCAKRKSVVSKCLLVEDVGCWLGLRCGNLQWLSCSARFFSCCACFRHYTQVSVSFASVFHCVRTFTYGLCVCCLANLASLTQNKRESTRASRSGAMWRHRIGLLSTSASTFKFSKIFSKSYYYLLLFVITFMQDIYSYIPETIYLWYMQCCFPWKTFCDLTLILSEVSVQCPIWLFSVIP